MLKNKIKVGVVIISLLLASTGIIYAEDVSIDIDQELDSNEEVEEVVEEEMAEQIEENIAPPVAAGEKISGEASWVNKYQELTSYKPSIVITSDIIYQENDISNEQEIYERSKVYLAYPNGTETDLEITAVNNHINFTNEKQIYEKIYEILKQQGKDIWYLDSGNKSILSYNGKLLVSYARGGKEYPAVTDAFNNIGEYKILFRTI